MGASKWRDGHVQQNDYPWNDQKTWKNMCSLSKPKCEMGNPCTRSTNTRNGSALHYCRLERSYRNHSPEIKWNDPPRLRFKAVWEKEGFCNGFWPIPLVKMSREVVGIMTNIKILSLTWMMQGVAGSGCYFQDTNGTKFYGKVKSSWNGWKTTSRQFFFVAQRRQGKDPERLDMFLDIYVGSGFYVRAKKAHF